MQRARFVPHDIAEMAAATQWSENACAMLAAALAPIAPALRRVGIQRFSARMPNPEDVYFNVVLEWRTNANAPAIVAAAPQATRDMWALHAGALPDASIMAFPRALALDMGLDMQHVIVVEDEGGQL